MWRLWANGTSQVVLVGNLWFIRARKWAQTRNNSSHVSAAVSEAQASYKSPLPWPWKGPEGQALSIHRCRHQETLDGDPDAHPAHYPTTRSLTDINLNTLPLPSTALTVSLAEGELWGWQHRVGSSPGAVICSAVPLTACRRLNRRSGTYRKPVSLS